MKKWFSLFLTLALLLTLLPGTVLAAGEPGEEPAAQAAAEAPVPVFQEPALPEEPLELQAGSGSVSGTVSLPNGGTALSDSYLYVYLCTPPVLDDDGQVLSEPVNVKSTQVTLAQGQSSGSYAISGVETGAYVLRVYSYVNSGSVLGGECYFNADGTPAGNPYAATLLNVGSGTRVNLTLPAAPRSISGTLVFDNAPAADTEFRLYCYDNDSSTSYSSNVTLRAGSKTVPFSIGVAPGLFPIQISSMETDAYGYYGIYGNATKDYQEQMVVNTLEKSVSGVEINCTGLLDGAAESGVVNVTVNLPAPLAEDRQYEIFLSDENGNSRTSYSTYLDAGTSSFTLPLSVDVGERFLVGYCDVTDCWNYYSPPTGGRYAAEDGITSQPSQAKFFTGGEVTSITISEPACYTVSGTLSREGDVLPLQAAYVLASFPDGEVYAARVVYAYGEASASYTIHVPQSQQGESFQLSTGKAVGGLGNQVNESTVTVSGSHTLSGNTQAELSLPAQTITISGTLSLPAGMTAPEDGLVITLGVTEDYRNAEYATYYLPQGESSLRYALCAPVSGSTTVFAEISGTVEGMARQAGGTFPQSQLMEAHMTFPETVTVSGTVSVPENCRDGVALVRLYFGGTLNGSRVYINLDLAVPAGEVSVPYSFTLPKGIQLTQGQLNVEADTLGILDTSYRYLQNDLKSFSSQYANLSATLSSDLTLDVRLTQGVFLSGTLSLAEGLSAGTYSGNIRLEPVNGGSSQSEYFDFTGTSYDYQFSLSEEAMGQAYYLSVYLHEGPGILPYKDYYYVSGGAPTTDRSKATPITLGEGGTVVDLTIPKARTISGSLVADDGEGVTWDPEETLWIYLESDTGSSDSFQATVDAQGSWTAAVDDTVSGTFKLRTYIYDSTPTNIIPATYYYKEGGPSVTDADEATRITVGEEDISGLELYVETGWVLSGLIHLPEGGYLTGGTVNTSVAVQTPDGGYTDYQDNTSIWQDGGSYSIKVPKQEAQYQLVLQVYSLPSEVSTNLYLRDELALAPVTVTGDTSGLDFTLVKAKAVITCTVLRPEGITGSLTLNLRVSVNGENSTDFYPVSKDMSGNEDSVFFSIPISPTKPGESYQLSYVIYNAEGVVINWTVYLCADGSLAVDPSLAGNFSLDGSTDHTFTPLTTLPFASGKIYCPEGLETPVSYVVYPQPLNELSTPESPQNGVEVMVGPGIGRQDADGRWYSAYTLSGLDVGSQYRLVCYSNASSTVADTTAYFVNSWDFLTKDEENAEIYTVYGASVNTVNFTPMLWDSGSEDYLLQSGHGISSLSQNTVWTYAYPGVTSLKVTFSGRTDVDLTINGTQYPCTELAGRTLEISGNTLEIQLDAFTDSDNSFGFAVERIEPVAGTRPEAAAAAVYTASGSSEEAILSGVKSGQPVRVTLVGDDPSYKETNMLGALYNAQGMLVDLVQVPVTFDGSTYTTSLTFEEYGQAVTLKLFLVDGDWAPRMEHCTFTQP